MTNAETKAITGERQGPPENCHRPGQDTVRSLAELLQSLGVAPVHLEKAAETRLARIRWRASPRCPQPGWRLPGGA